MLKPLVFLITLTFTSVSLAGTSSVGIVLSNGEVRVAGSVIRGNGTVFNGDVVETTTSRSMVQVGATSILLAPNSRVKIYRDHVVFEHGTGVVKDSSNKVVFANNLQIVSLAPQSAVQIQVDDTKHLAVASRSGSTEVRDSIGQSVARLAPGASLGFTYQAPEATAVRLAGIVTKQDGSYVLTDSLTRITFQLNGSGLEQYVGKFVNISGATVPNAPHIPGTSVLVQISSLQISQAPPQAPKQNNLHGLSRTSKALLVGGITVGAAVVGLAAAGSFTGGTTSIP